MAKLHAFWHDAKAPLIEYILSMQVFTLKEMIPILKVPNPGTAYYYLKGLFKYFKDQGLLRIYDTVPNPARMGRGIIVYTVPDLTLLELKTQLQEAWDVYYTSVHLPKVTQYSARSKDKRKSLELSNAIAKQPTGKLLSSAEIDSILERILKSRT